MLRKIQTLLAVAALMALAACSNNVTGPETTNAIHNELAEHQSRTQEYSEIAVEEFVDEDEGGGGGIDVPTEADNRRTVARRRNSDFSEIAVEEFEDSGDSGGGGVDVPGSADDTEHFSRRRNSEVTPSDEANTEM